jgi:hypothetical protein
MAVSNPPSFERVLRKGLEFLDENLKKGAIKAKSDCCACCK